MYSIGIIMSVYNGSAFLREQLDSIFNQRDCDIHLYVRDDGSIDNSVEILKEYLKKFIDKITILEGGNIGFIDSFMKALYMAKLHDFYAFADQDDIWETNKIVKAIEHIDISTPCLYGSNLKAFDIVENRHFFVYDLSKKDSVKDIMAEYIFLSNPYGCTMVWNKALHKSLMKLEKPISMTHDVWVNLVARVCGNVFFDYDNSYINYRIHGNNACGATPDSLLQKYKKYFKFYFKDNRKLNISLICSSICHMFPEKAMPIDYALASYDKSIFNWFKAIIAIIGMKVPIKNKFKYLLLALFGKL